MANLFRVIEVAEMDSYRAAIRFATRMIRVRDGRLVPRQATGACIRFLAFSVTWIQVAVAVVYGDVNAAIVAPEMPAAEGC